jgi:diaminohydroxyphosphoribosylaminopyrimidine deaminase/5-amino-6-(5-phosphoribosylamino)uracil reductase
MRQALRLAARGRGFTSPNPIVGALVVRDGVVVGKGYHTRVGGPHAEVNALREAGEAAKGATLYVTLEPCNHFGRTPPCTQAVLEAGIARVVVGMADPNINVQGGGVDYLRSYGIRVDVGILEKECRLLNQAFIKHSTTGLPLVILKTAATLDGRIAARSGDSRWVTNERSRRFGHRLRCDLDAVLVGIGTVLADDPELTARIPGRRCHQPVRIVLDSRLKLPLTSKLVNTVQQSPVWVACRADAPAADVRRLEEAGVEVLRIPGGGVGVDLCELLCELGRRNLTSILVEGGARVHGAFLDQHLADAFYFFYAPKILADGEALPMISGQARERMAEALCVHDLQLRRFDGDVVLHGRLRELIY